MSSKFVHDLSKFKPKFLKPGDYSSEILEERKEAHETEQPAIYNANSTLPCDQQRQRLPIYKYRNHILYLMETYQTVIILGETGCGKSTQIPQYLLEAGYFNNEGIIGITQPRRVAATMLASRVAEETDTLVGQVVGYSIRFEDCFTAGRTKIKYMTEGMLINEMMSDPLLRSYSVIMLDEIHERSLNGDIILGLIKKIIKKRSSLKLIISSATFEAETIHKFFNKNETQDRTKDTAVKAFKPVARSVRKVVVSTNIAEASVTISGITYVIDCCFVKLKCFNMHSCTDSLVIVPVSQASAEQRAGRAGRVRSGKAYRLCTEEDFLKLPSFTVPEMQRSNLAPVILQLKALGIENILRFSFPSAPPSKHVISAIELLYALGALDDNGALTSPLGVQMAEFPLHPMFSKLLLVSGEFNCTEEVLSIAAMLQVQNVFKVAPGRKLELKRAKWKFAVEEGDFITLLNVYNAFLKNNNKYWCEQNFLNYKGLQRAVEIRSQLSKLLKKFKVPNAVNKDEKDSLRKCIVSAFFANAAYLHYTGVYKTVRGDHTLHIHPESVVSYTTQPKWVIFNEVLHTTKEYMRDITVIEPQWLYELAPHYYQYGTDREVGL
ncbi:putative ATP-dependent RNA helicase DHX35 like protein [Argiope bruennichi]|uniref:RNA helicase n=1 Tax=Argiope bruennichi TaxID=94029 RepID=A0A8T0EUN2_ARGBR|nr:putative ATP-dependent RNA helicase DHX35 like protein [Argiope bruennichi]